MSWYRTGTASVTNNSNTVTGSGTSWSFMASVGDTFTTDNNMLYEIIAIVSDTEITLDRVYAGTTEANSTYAIIPYSTKRSLNTELLDRLNALLAWMQESTAPLDSPEFTGVPKAPTPAAGTTTTQIVNAQFVDAEFSARLKDASATVKGVVKVGSNISVADGVISVPEATETVKGVVELATSAEVLAGTDTTRAVTPDTLTAKILGTVSQVGGVPTGAIIESGSNANGSYVKFADGTAICWKSVAWAGTETYRPTTTLPIAMVSATYMGEFIASSSETTFLVFSVAYLTSSTVYYWVQEVLSTGTVTKRGASVTVKILVIGRWF